MRRQIRQHTNYELILVESGPYRCALNGEELQLERGQILVIKRGDRHQDHLRDGQRHYVVQFRLLPAGGRTPAIDLFRAEAMLRHRGMRVQEVSNDLGFANPYHFSRVFRREWGLPPSVWARS